MRSLVFTLLGMMLYAVISGAQPIVDVENQHDRAIVVVPIIGSGTYNDPIRPANIPASPEARATLGLLSFTYEISDDKKYAIVELIGRDSESLQKLLSASGSLKTFRKGSAKKADIEREVRAFKKDFQLGGLKDGGKRP